MKPQKEKIEPIINRDLDWLLFNKRVLEEANDVSNPIYERLKFLGIFSSNLDEFFRVRVSKLRQIRKVDKKLRKPLSLKPNKQLKKILNAVDELQDLFGKVYQESILPDLNKHGISFKSIEDCTKNQKSYLLNYFRKKVIQHIKIYGDTVDRDDISNGSLYLCTSFTDSESLAFVYVPNNELERFVKLPTKDRSIHQFVFIEDIIKFHSQHLFKNKLVAATHLIKLSRDAELYLEDDYQGPWINQIYQSLAERQIGQPTRLLFENCMPKDIQARLRKKLNLGKIDMIKGGKRHNFNDFVDFPKILNNENAYAKPMPPIKKNVFEINKNIFKVIKEKDRLLHFPYQSFSYIESILEAAAKDLKVTSIHISLYRIAETSRLSKALLTAIKNGKEVIIFIEAKARFDEHNNIIGGKYLRITEPKCITVLGI